MMSLRSYFYSKHKKEKEMVMPCMCKNADEIRRLLTEHGDELVKEKQEIKIAWRGTMPIPSIGLLHCYGSLCDSKDSDTLSVYLGGEVAYIISPSMVTHFEVLPTKKMTGDLFLADMRQMEHTSGLDTPE
jgi:hypothetical protein